MDFELFQLLKRGDVVKFTSGWEGEMGKISNVTFRGSGGHVSVELFKKNPSGLIRFVTALSNQLENKIIGRMRNFSKFDPTNNKYLVSRFEDLGIFSVFRHEEEWKVKAGINFVIKLYDEDSGAYNVVEKNDFVLSFQPPVLHDPATH